MEAEATQHKGAASKFVGSAYSTPSRARLLAEAGERSERRGGRGRGQRRENTMGAFVAMLERVVMFAHPADHASVCQGNPACCVSLARAEAGRMQGEAW